MSTSSSKLLNPSAALRPRSSDLVNPCAGCPVRATNVCAGLNNDECVRLVAIATRIQIDAKRAVFSEADPARHVFNVTAGSIRLSKTLADGRRQITGFLFPGDFLGIAYAKTYAYTAEAMTALSLCRFERQRFEALFSEIPALERRVLEVASNEIKAAQDHMLLLGRKNAKEKLLSFLWSCSKRTAHENWPAGMVELPMKRADMADYLGLTVETVSRTFSRLVNEGVLELLTNHSVSLCQPERLHKLAEGE